MSLHIYSHNPNSEGAKALAEALGIKRIKHVGSKFNGRKDRTVINWGSSKLPDFGASPILNQPKNVGPMTNKLTFFELMDGAVSIPDWTGDIKVARQWQAEGATVCARAVLNGSSGDGLTVHKPGEALPNVKLYTKYVPKKDEYRVHVVNDEVIHVQRKARDLEVPDDKVNWQVRNLEGGFIFQQHNVEPPQDVLDQAKKCMDLSGLDFGAVDVIYNTHHKRAYVLEVNTAPGLVGTTVERYKAAFQRFM